MATDLPDWTQAVTVESGTVDIGGTAAVTITSGTVDANITNASVPISGSVSISSGTVDISAGTVDVQNAAGTVIATGNAIDYLGTVTLGAGFSSVIHKFTVTKSYSALLVTAKGGTSPPLCIGVLSTTWNTTHSPAPAFGAAFSTKGNAADSAGWQAIAGCGSQPTSTVELAVYRTGTTGTMTVQVYGVTETPAGGVPLRPDGRAYPLGALGASKQAGTTAVALVTTTAPLRPLVKTLSLSATFLESSALYRVMKAKVYGTLNGATVTLLQVVAAGLQTSSANSAREYPGGFLLDAGSSVEVIAGGVVGTSATNLVALADLTYDLVV